MPDDSPIARRYVERTPRSAEAYARALKSLAGGTSRQAGHWLPHPLTVVQGQGTRLTDLDGLGYIDAIGNYTSLVHGHAYPPIVAAIEAQVRRGTAWSAGNLPLVELAELIIERVPSIEEVRFTNSGTESANLALLIARAVTGRHQVLMAKFGYHGSVHEFELGHDGLEGPMTRIARFGDAEAFERVLREHGDRIAAVFLEPVLGSGVVAAARPFLERVQAAAKRAGALFVLDEVITLRLGIGGLQGLLGITPDLTLLGKIIGGGLPVGGVGGRREFMRVFHPPAPSVYHTGTFAGNPVTMAAGLVSLRDLTEERIARMDRLAERLDRGLVQAGRRVGVPFSVNRSGSLLQVFLSEQPPAVLPERTDTAEMKLFHLAALNHGLFIAPRGMMALSTVMDEAEIDEIVSRAERAMRDLVLERREERGESGE